MLYDERNRKIIEKLDPVMQERVTALLRMLEMAGEDVLLTDGYRTVKEQNALHAQGRTKPGKIVTYVKGDESFHCWGVSVDLVPVDPNGKVRYDATARYERVAAVARELGMEWGIDVWGYDAPHFMYRQGLTIADLRAGKRLKPLGPEPLTEDELRQKLRNAENALRWAKGPRKNLLTRLVDRLKRILGVVE